MSATPTRVSATRAFFFFVLIGCHKNISLLMGKDIFANANTTM